MAVRVHCEKMADAQRICMKTGDMQKPVCDRQDCPGSAEQRKAQQFLKGIIYLTPDNSSGSYLFMQRAIPPQPRGGCYAG